LTLINVEAGFEEKVIAPNFPREPARGNYELRFMKELFEQSDIRE